MACGYAEPLRPASGLVGMVLGSCWVCGMYLLIVGENLTIESKIEV